MGFSKRISPALLALAGVLVADGVRAEMTYATGGRVGALRTSLGQLSQGLSFSFAQGLRYDSNIVRTANSAETLALYGTSSASDWVSQTGVNSTFYWKTGKSTIQFNGDAGYAHYFRFDEFSGWVASGAGAWTWNFTTRCSSTVRARAERSLANFADISATQNTFQTSLSGSVHVGCFILDQVRLTAGGFGDQVKNEKSLFEINDLSTKGYEASLAFVTPRKNEVGVHYRNYRSKRPNDPTASDAKNASYDVYGILHLGDRTRLFGSFGNETNKRAGLGSIDRSTVLAAVAYAPTAKLAANLSYERHTEDAPDIVNTQRQVDRVSGDAGWRVGPRVTLGGYAVHERDTLQSPTLLVLNGVKEKQTSVGVYLQHTLFQAVSVKWTAGYSERDSDQPLREFESATAGVSLGIGF